MEIAGESALPVISVKIESLTDFISFMERDVDPDLGRGLAQARHDATTGQQLCAGIGGPMIGGSKENYEYAQRYPIDNMVRYLFTGAAMLETIDKLTQLYRNAEEMATLSTEEVHGMLTAAYDQKKVEFEAWQAANPRDTHRNFVEE